MAFQTIVKVMLSFFVLYTYGDPIEIPKELSEETARNSIISSIVKTYVPKQFQQEIETISSALYEQVKTSKSCRTDVCFTLESTSNITPSQFDLQKVFSALMGVIASADEKNRFSAVQYVNVTLAITPQTQDINGFVSAIESSVYINDTESNLVAALTYCASELLHSRQGNKQKIIALGTGSSTVGFEPRFVYEQITSEGISFLGVSTGGQIRNLSPIVDTKSNPIIWLRKFKHLVMALKKSTSFICS